LFFPSSSFMIDGLTPIPVQVVEDDVFAIGSR